MQVSVTTHSLDVLRALQAVLSEAPYARYQPTAVCYALERDAGGSVRPYRYDGTTTISSGTAWTVFVEGRSDEAFLRCVLRHLNITNVATERINGGVRKLGKVARQMQRRSLRGNRIFVILDADADFEKRRGEYETARSQHELPIDRFFLLPNHRDTG